MKLPSRISYLDETWPVGTGCTKVSEACENCFAARYAATRGKHLAAYQGLARLNGHGRAQWTGEVRLHPDKLDLPLHWRRPRRIGVAFTGDLFHDAVPDEFIDQVFAVMALSPQHTFLVLTKRPERMLRFLGALIGKGIIADYVYHAMPLPNVWLGVTAENQEEADRRIPLLLQTPAAKRWVSIEPMLGSVNLNLIDLGDKETLGYGPKRVTWEALTPWEHQSKPGIAFDGDFGRREAVASRSGQHPALDWVVLGCESGPNPRPMQLDWARSVRDQCVAAQVPFYFKQAMSVGGKLIHLPYLDGQQYEEMP